VVFANRNRGASAPQLTFFRRVYFRNWRKFGRHPVQGIGFIAYHIAKFGFGGAGYLVGRISSTSHIRDSNHGDGTELS
jgi:hypothetical protein